MFKERSLVNRIQSRVKKQYSRLTGRSVAVHGTRMIDVPGWFEPADIRAYRELLDRLPDNALVVEVGSWKGRSTINAAWHRPTLRLIAVDTFAGSESEQETNHAEALSTDDRVFRRFLRNVAASRTSNVSVLRMRSEEAAALFQDGSVDLVFIDADHEYEDVNRDLACWQRTIRAGGWIAGHDYQQENGVARAVREYTDEASLMLYGNSTVWAVCV